MSRIAPALALLVAAPLAHAASTKPENPAAATAPAPAAIESIVVTAHRLPTREPVLPVHARDPAAAPPIGLQALRDLPSLAISQSGSLGSLTQIRVRGAEANHLLVLIDGVDVMDPTTDAGYNFANLNLAGVSRLEFLPGAQSAVWGNQALAGVLHLSTEPTGRIRRMTLESGSFDSRYGSIQLADHGGDWYYNLSAADFSTDGTNVARQGSERDGYDNNAWFASGGVNRDRWSLRGLVRRTWTTSEFDPTPFPTYLPVDGDDLNTHDETLALVGLDLRGDSRPWRERLTLSVFDTDNSTETDGDRTARTDGRRWKITSVTEVPVTARQDVIVLLEHQSETFEQWGEATPFGDPNQRQEMDTSSAGIEYLVRPTDRWRISASARHDVNSEFSDSDSLRLAASYQWREDTLFWAAAGTGIKQPSFVERYGFTPDSFIGNPDLEAEENRHLSVGGEYRRGSWVHGLTLYRDRLEDEINGFLFDPELGGFTAGNDDGTSKRHGVEWNSAREWSGGTLRVGANYLDSEDFDGAREIRRPQWQAFATLSQRWRRFTFDAGAFYVDDQDDLDFATWPAAVVALDDYTLVHAGLRVELRRGVELGVRASNLLDATYEDILGYRGPGRALYLNLGVEL